MSKTSILIAKILAVLLLAVLLTSAALSPRWAARVSCAPVSSSPSTF